MKIQLAKRVIDDTRLRGFGYRLHLRPNNAEATWKDATGKIVTQSVAVATVKKWIEEQEKLGLMG